MSTFNPGTNEPTSELGSEPEDWDEKHGVSNEGQGEIDPANLGTEQDGPDRDPSGYHGETVADAQAYINDATDDADRVRRANEVEQAENERDGDNRVGVTEAVEKARQPRT